MVDRKVIITCALTGAQQGKDRSPHLPEQPDEIIEQGLAAWRAGAAILHLHARDAAGRATADVSVFRRIVQGLRQAGCRAVFNLTTGGAVAGLPLDQRLAVVPELKPEIATFSLGGGCLLGRWSDEVGAWVNDRFVPLFESHAQIEEVARRFREHGVRPEIELYHAGMLNNLRAMIARGALASPYLVNLVTGIPGECTPCEERDIRYLAEGLPEGALWLVSAIGARNHFRIIETVVRLGGHVRVGLEDCLHLEPGRLARCNAELVERAVELLGRLGREPASADEARARLHLPPLGGNP